MKDDEGTKHLDLHRRRGHPDPAKDNKGRQGA